jgi:hypothetical protein
MDFVWGVLKIIVGGFLLFTIARVAYARMVPRAGWAWVALVSVLAIGNMLVQKWLGSSINPPFFTAVLFAMTLMGLAPDNTVTEGAVSEGSRWFKRGAIAVAIFTAVGWLAYGTISRVGAV